MRKDNLKRQRHTLPFLLLNPTVKAAAKQSGVSAKQIFDWLNQSHFREELEKRGNESVNQAFDKLKLTASKACDTPFSLLDNAQSDSVKHLVVVDMLNMTLKFMEFKDMEQRLRKLEETITS